MHVSKRHDRQIGDRGLAYNCSDVAKAGETGPRPCLLLAVPCHYQKPTIVSYTINKIRRHLWGNADAVVLLEFVSLLLHGIASTVT